MIRILADITSRKSISDICNSGALKRKKGRVGEGEICLCEPLPRSRAKLCKFLLDLEADISEKLYSNENED
jgi:hypothetical protein